MEATENDTNIQDKLNEILSLYDNESAEADTIETTVTGINPFAAFSITDFTSRKNYKNFEEFSVDEQNFIITLVFAAETGDMDVAWELMGTDIFDEGLTSSGTYTIYNSYKLNIARYISTSVTTNGQSESQIENNIVKIEIRPENGFGYYIYMSMNQEADNIYYTTCQCEDWQWNGEYVCERYLRWYAVGIYRLVTMTGEMVDNLRNGIFYSVTKSAYESSNYENYKITAEETSIYNKGWKVDEYTGEVIGSSIYGPNSIYHSPHSRNTYDDLYW